MPQLCNTQNMQGYDKGVHWDQLTAEENVRGWTMACVYFVEVNSVFFSIGEKEMSATVY